MAEQMEMRKEMSELSTQSKYAGLEAVITAVTAELLIGFGLVLELS